MKILHTFCNRTHYITTALKSEYKSKHIVFSFLRFNSSNIEKTKSITKEVNIKEIKATEVKAKDGKQKEKDKVLYFLQNKNNAISTRISNIGTFNVVKAERNLPYERFLCKPDNYKSLQQLVTILEKEDIKKDYDIYFYEEELSNIKLNREQNKKEIFINVQEIMQDKKIKNDEKRNFLEKKNINSIYYYNIQRYEHNADPSSFLIDKKRLTKEEYRYQYISTILPYLCFTFMLFFPHFLICLYIPYIKEKNKKQRELCTILQIKQNIHPYKDIKPEYIANILDNNIKTIIFFYNNDIFLNMYMKSLMVDLSQIFKQNSIPINIVGIDTSKYNIPQNVLADINQDLLPLLYFVLPYHYDNDSAVLKFNKPFVIENIINQIKDFVYIPKNMISHVKELDKRTNKLKQCIFEREIMNQKEGDILYDYGSEIAHLSCLQHLKTLF
ncbi:conserved protein, unknown function [Hepatocystis sp. ex Piliocolobus tephrosceles]|nr:conserved protein, unknown function [Hepatocystis sp. ex Piliocolobus tephrosceles]